MSYAVAFRQAFCHRFHIVPESERVASSLMRKAPPTRFPKSGNPSNCFIYYFARNWPKSTATHKRSIFYTKLRWKPIHYLFFTSWSHKRCYTLLIVTIFLDEQISSWIFIHLFEYLCARGNERPTSLNSPQLLTENCHQKNAMIIFFFHFYLKHQLSQAHAQFNFNIQRRKNGMHPISFEEIVIFIDRGNDLLLKQMFIAENLGTHLRMCLRVVKWPSSNLWDFFGRRDVRTQIWYKVNSVIHDNGQIKESIKLYSVHIDNFW